MEVKNFWKSVLTWFAYEMMKTLFIVTFITGMTVIAIKAWGV